MIVLVILNNIKVTDKYRCRIHQHNEDDLRFKFLILTFKQHGYTLTCRHREAVHLKLEKSLSKIKT